MQELKLKQNMKQVQHMSPQMLQSTRILQMDAQELRDYVSAALEENPVLDREPEQQAERELVQLRREVGWLGGGRTTASQGAQEEAYRPEPGAWDEETSSAQALLRDQLERKALKPDLLALCNYLVELLDEDGYLTQEELATVQELGVPETLVRRAVETVQSLEPAGIAARDLRECLLLQLVRHEGDTSLAQRMVEAYLPLLGQKRWRTLAQKLHTTETAVQAAAEMIQRLSPRPAYTERSAPQPEYVTPDVFVAERDGRLQVFLNEYYTPRIFISGYYAAMLNETTDEETKTFLQQRMQQARWIIDCLERRHSTLERCANLIFEMQNAFFRDATPHLVPVTQKEAAAMLGLHESTVGRCIRGKYLQCRQGTYPLQYFFSRPVSAGEPLSEQAVRWELKQLIRQENREKPLSDQSLCRLLSQRGMTVARRTVTKYRRQMAIPPAYARRQWQNT